MSKRARLPNLQQIGPCYVPSKLDDGSPSQVDGRNPWKSIWSIWNPYIHIQIFVMNHIGVHPHKWPGIPANASFQKEESSLAVSRAPALRRSCGGMIPWVGYRCTFYLYMVDVFWIYYAHGLKFDSDRIHLLTNVDKCFVAVWFGDYQPIIFFQCLKTISKICEILSYGPRDIIIWSLNLQVSHPTAPIWQPAAIYCTGWGSSSQLPATCWVAWPLRKRENSSTQMINFDLFQQGNLGFGFLNLIPIWSQCCFIKGTTSKWPYFWWW
jgi:hypothetical protein